jgi:hypothetical protein
MAQKSCYENVRDVVALLLSYVMQLCRVVNSEFVELCPNLC